MDTGTNSMATDREVLGGIIAAYREGLSDAEFVGLVIQWFESTSAAKKCPPHDWREGYNDEAYCGKCGIERDELEEYISRVERLEQQGVIEPGLTEKLRHSIAGMDDA